MFQMLPTVAYSDNPSTSFAAKFVHTSLNKNRCSINRVLVYPSKNWVYCIILCLPCLSIEESNILLFFSNAVMSNCMRSLLIGFLVFSGHLQEDDLSQAPKVGSLLFGMGNLLILK